jgi:acyl-coenzyme A synthetase/AMP-(fatty) acid ligase
VNVAARVLHFARTQPEAPAFIEGERTLTYGDLDVLVARMASGFAQLGLRPGDRVGICLKDTPDHIVALLAVTWMGAVAVPLDWRARPTENAHFAGALGLACLLVEPDIRPTVGCPVVVLDEVWRRAVPGVRVPAALDWTAPFVIAASSGSTGAPKFTVMTHLQYHFAIAGMFEAMAIAGRHRFLCTLPLYYSGGRNSCLAHLLRGDCVILYPSLLGPREYVDLSARHGATVGVIVPSTVRALMAVGRSEPLLPGFAALFCTGAPLFPEEKLLALRTLSPNFHERYGTAETLVIAILRPADFTLRPASVGQPVSLAEIEVVDDDERALPDGELGRLRYRGPGLAEPLPGQEQQANFLGGWFYPGEIAHLDDRGFIFLEGRASEVIFRNGAKIYPVEVEAALCEHPAIAEAAVVGHPAGVGEDEVVAFVVGRRALRIGEVIAHCRNRLTPHKVPRRIVFVERLPRNTAGKVDKPALCRELQGQA